MVIVSARVRCAAPVGVCARARLHNMCGLTCFASPRRYIDAIYIEAEPGYPERRETLSHPPHYRRTRPSYIEYTKTDDSVYSVVSVETERTPEKSVSLDRYIERVSPC